MHYYVLTGLNINRFSTVQRGVDVVKKSLLCALVICCLATYQSYAQIAWDAEKFMPLSEVKKGMKGKGYTIFFGTTVEGI